MEVGAGGSEAATLAPGTFESPANVLNFTLSHGLADMRIVGMRAAFALHGAFRGMSRQDGRDALHVRLKAHVEIRSHHGA